MSDVHFLEEEDIGGDEALTLAKGFLEGGGIGEDFGLELLLEGILRFEDGDDLRDMQGFFDVPRGDAKELTKVGILAQRRLALSFGSDVGDDGRGLEAVQSWGQLCVWNRVFR